ncbi:MAG: hypothetical protein H6753_00925 [Candidatus Omnitrophica bacterium]|nr:hypothetical protein [Candidatus Omnitrophota bacterium]
MERFSVKKSFFSIALVLFLLTGSGCFYLVIGGVGALGGYAISPDTVEGMVSGYTMQDIWQAAVDTVSIMGLIEEKNEIAGVVVAKVSGAHITVTVAEPVADTVKLRVKARRGMMPRIKLAQDIYTKIVQRSHP